MLPLTGFNIGVTHDHYVFPNVTSKRASLLPRGSIALIASVLSPSQGRSCGSCRARRAPTPENSWGAGRIQGCPLTGSVKFVCFFLNNFCVVNNKFEFALASRRRAPHPFAWLSFTHFSSSGTSINLFGLDTPLEVL